MPEILARIGLVVFWGCSIAAAIPLIVAVGAIAIIVRDIWTGTIQDLTGYIVLLFLSLCAAGGLIAFGLACRFVLGGR